MDYAQKEQILEKIAVIEIKTMSVKMQMYDVARNKYFALSKVVEMPINLTKDFYGDSFIKPNVIKDITNILNVYKAMIESVECSEVICLASAFVSEAKNANGFLNELAVNTGFKFRVVDGEESSMAVYTAVINSFNRPKGLIVNIQDYSSEVVLYNRRNILGKVEIPYGYSKVYDTMSGKSMDEIENYVGEEVKKILDASGIKDVLPDEYDVIGCGQTFLDYGSVCRKAKKYPLELSHNYVSTKNDFEKVYGLIKGYGISSTTKIKGVTLNNSRFLPCGLVIARAVINYFDKPDFSISKMGIAEGKLFNSVLPITLEKPISDTLGYSLQMLNDLYDRKPNNSQHIYELSIILFKQLKVLHKLGRAYVKVLRIASYMLNSGYRVDVENSDRSVFDIIKNSEIFGINQNEIVMAAFVALGKNQDNFALSEWIRFKEYLTEEDLMAVKKLSVILKIAESLDVTGFGLVNDISCDILGDSVIMKTIATKPAQFEIDYTMLSGADFKKAFGKNLEVL